MLHLLLVRHGETDWNAQHRYQGHSDPPLNQKGIEQARRLAARLESQAIDGIFSSDLQRAMQTAEILKGQRSLAVLPDARLRELKFGVLEGHTFAEALELWPEMISQWVSDNNRPPDGGERSDDFARRVTGFTDEIRQSCADKTVLVVAHAGTLRVIIQRLLRPAGEPGLFPDKVWFTLENGSLSDFEVDEENIIINRLNYSC
jgi:broad specificity phosphatase PhoE